MAPYQLPEIKRVPLEDLTLQILLKGSQPAEFLSKALDPPTPEAIRAAVHNLRELGAIATTMANTGSGGTSSSETAMQCELTPLGFHLAHIPVEPRVEDADLRVHLWGSTTVADYCCRLVRVRTHTRFVHGCPQLSSRLLIDIGLCQQGREDSFQRAAWKAGGRRPIQARLLWRGTF